jgi:hypothetical protein
VNIRGVLSTTLMKPVRAENPARDSVGTSHVIQESNMSNKKGSSSKPAAKTTAKPATKSASKSITAKVGFPTAPAIGQANQTHAPAPLLLSGPVNPQVVEALRREGVPVRKNEETGEYVITEEQRQAERRHEQRRQATMAAEAAGIKQPEFHPATMTTPAAAPQMTFAQEGTPAASAASTQPVLQNRRASDQQVDNRGGSTQTRPVDESGRHITRSGQPDQREKPDTGGPSGAQLTAQGQQGAQAFQVPAGTMANAGHAGTDGQKADWKVQQDQGQQQPAADPTQNPAFKAEMEAISRKYGVTLPVFGGAPVTTPSSGKIQQNNITRPGPNTKTGHIWNTADAISQAQGSPAGIAQLKGHPDMRNFNDHTIRTQYARWRAFHGLRGRDVTGGGQPQQQQQVNNQPQQPAAGQATSFVPAQPAGIPTQTPPPAVPMSDEDYQMCSQMLRNNLLPDLWRQALDTESIRRHGVAASRK